MFHINAGVQDTVRCEPSVLSYLIKRLIVFGANGKALNRWLWRWNSNRHLFETLFTKKYTTMKELIEIMLKDIKDENFTKREYIVYGILTPLVLVALMAVAGWLETM